MYEARQNKENVSRQIDVGVRTRQRMEKGKKTEEAETVHSNENSNCIQRKVGFEFETGWKVDKKHIIRDNAGWFDKGFFRTACTRLAKKELIYSGQDFHIEADDGENNMSEIEFVTDPIDKKEQLTPIMDSIKIVGGRLLEHEKEKRFNFNSFVVYPIENELKANPQMTFGMDLSKLNDFMKHTAIGKPKKENLKIVDNKKLIGLIRLIQQYILQGEGNIDDINSKPLSYPKQIADIIMARTDFAKLLALTDANISLQEWIECFSFEEKDKLFSRGVLKDDIDENDYLREKEKLASEIDYSKKMKRYKRKVIYIPDLTVKDWLENIFNKKDKLTEIKDHEGMGEMGNKTDIVNKKEVGIFEFRQLQRSAIPLKEWRDFALYWLNEVNSFNSSVPADL